MTRLGPPIDQEAFVLSEYPYFTALSLPDQLRVSAFEGEDRLALPMLNAIQRTAYLLEEVGWAVQPPSLATS